MNFIIGTCGRKSISYGRRCCSARWFWGWSQPDWATRWRKWHGAYASSISCGVGAPARSTGHRAALHQNSVGQDQHTIEPRRQPLIVSDDDQTGTEFPI